MRSRKYKIFKPFIIFIVFVLAWYGLPSVYKGFVKASFYEFVAPLDSANAYMKDLQTYWGLRSRSKTELIEAGRDLARLNASYVTNMQENTALKSRIKILENLLKVPELIEYRKVVCRVQKREISSWWQRITIRHGANADIKRLSGVIFEGGVVGRVVEVGMYSSVVELATSPSFRISCQITGDERPVIYKGVGGEFLSKPRGEVTNIDVGINFEQSNEIILETTGLGGTFPEGVRIGKVKNFKNLPSGIFKKADVILSNDLYKIKEVVVLVPILEEKSNEL